MVKIKLQHTLISAVIGGIAGMSDGFMYAYLPVEAANIGLSAWMVGVLLSANRFIRFFSNRWIAYYANKFGVKQVYIAGIVFTFISGILYALHSFFIVWLLARIIWGICFSAIRFCNLQYNTKADNVATAMGWSKSLHEIISIIGYLSGPILVLNFGGQTCFVIYALLIVLLIPAFYKMPPLQIVEQKIKAFKVQLPNASDIWGFLVSFGIDGLLIISLSKIIPAPAKGENLLLFASYYIAVRKIITIVLSPLIGWIMDKISLIHSVYLCCLCIILGFLHLAWWDINIGLTLTFIGSSINHTLIPLITVKNSTEKQQFNNLTKMSTSRDLGSAFGALFGLAIVQFISPNYLFVALAIAINIPIIWIIQSANLKNTAILQHKN